MFGQKPRTARPPKQRNFGEITSLDDFKTKCLNYKKACAIGMLSAVTVIEYEQAN